MPRAQLLTSTVKRLACPTGKDQELFWDHGHKDAVRGLGLRVTATGTRTYIIRGYPNGKERRIDASASPLRQLHRPRPDVRQRQ